MTRKQNRSGNRLRSGGGDSLTAAEVERLDELEQRISTAWDQAALALAEIKDAKLYRCTRDGRKQTWEQYCKRIHGLTPQWANTLVRRAKTLQRIRAKSETPVSLSPTAVGHLEGLEPEEQAEIIEEATKKGQKPTSKEIADAKHKKLMARFKTGGDMHQGADPKKPTQPLHYKLTVVTPEKADLEKFGQRLPSPITDFKAHSISAWIRLTDIEDILAKVGKALGTTQPKKVRMVVEL